MGAEREDTDPRAARPGSEPGLGHSEEEPATVDFDALHAALGDPLDYEEMPSGPALEVGVTGESDELLDGLEASLAARGNGLSESSGRSSATYSSSRPRTIPPARLPVEDPNAPAVIVATDDTVPTAAPQMTAQMTVPLAPAQRGGPPFGGHPGAPPMGMGHPGSHPALPNAMPPHGGMRGSHPNMPAAPSYGQTPVPFPAQARGVPQMTMRMPDRPLNPRRGKTATVVVRPRGPSAKQKLIAFMAMLLLVTACGIAVIIWRKPRWLGLEALTGPSATTSVLAMPSGAPPAPHTATAPAPTTVAATATATAAVAPATPAATNAAGAGGGVPAAASGAAAPGVSVVKKKPLPVPVPVPAPHPSALR